MPPTRSERFNSRTHEGCDSEHSHPQGCVSCFNSRTHERCDQQLTTSTSPAVRFNSRTHEGCDTAAAPAHTLTELFQFTHPRGVRQMRPCSSKQ